MGAGDGGAGVGEEMKRCKRAWMVDNGVEPSRFPSSILDLLFSHF